MTAATLAGATTSYAYDPSGNRTSVTKAGTTTGYAYDAADRLTAIDPPGAANTVSFSFDALSRNRTRSVNGALADTYGYLGESETVVRLTRAATTVDAALTAADDRIAIRSGTSLGWTLPDLHGSLAALASGTGTTLSDAFRYDAYGETAAAVTSATPTPWRYQGKLLVSSPGDAELYENGARYYDPGLGAFTQLDAVAGSAQHPSSLNRYLYAWANPATLTDPTGNCPGCVRWMEGIARRSPPPPPPRKQHHRHTAPHRKPRPTPRYKAPSPTRLSIHWRFEAAQDRRWERERAARRSLADRQRTHGAWLAFEGRADARAEPDRVARASVAATAGVARREETRSRLVQHRE